MSQDKREFPDVDNGMIAWGVLMGALIGGIVTLFTAPKRGEENRQQITEVTQSVRQRIETTIQPTDPVKESMAEGKAAALRRRDKLGVD